jgi:hypothetical protein
LCIKQITRGFQGWCAQKVYITIYNTIDFSDSAPIVYLVTIRGKIPWVSRRG